MTSIKITLFKIPPGTWKQKKNPKNIYWKQSVALHTVAVLVPPRELVWCTSIAETSDCLCCWHMLAVGKVPSYLLKYGKQSKEIPRAA